MAKKHKFYFDPHLLTYVKHSPLLGEKAIRVGGILASSILIFILSFSIYVYQNKTPDEKKQLQLIAFYKKQVGYLNNKLKDVNNDISRLQKRDKDLYRVIFQADPLPDDVLNAGTGGTDKYVDLEGFNGSDEIIKTNLSLDKLNAEISIMDQSYDQLFKLAKAKEKMLASLPAIQPISNKDLESLASGFGYRLHPIYKTRMMHSGLDFTANIGTPIYATGDGIVGGINSAGAGYGRHVLINHGFGYQTLYGHMSKVLVKRGQKIKRGELIGLVGNSGISTGPHLHYEVVKNGRKINPINFFHNDLKPSDYKKLVELANNDNQSFD